MGVRAGRWVELGLLEVEVEDPEPTGSDDHDQAAATWVQAAPFRAHLRLLITSTGVPWRTIAVLAEVPSAALHRLLHGRYGRPIQRLHPVIAERLFRLTPEMISDAGIRPRHSGETRAVLSLLLGRGWSTDELALRSGLIAGELDAIADGRQRLCSQLTAATVQALAQALWDTPVPQSAGRNAKTQQSLGSTGRLNRLTRNDCRVLVSL